MKKPPPLFLLCSMIMFIAGCKSDSFQPEKIITLRFSPETTVITGVLRENSYFSVMEGSDTEYMNEIFILYLEKPVMTAANEKVRAKTFLSLKDIDHIEIENNYDFTFADHLGKRVRLTGSVTLIGERAGCHRQVSTPVQIFVTKMNVLGE